MKEFFNWFAEKPSRQYTLGGDSLAFKFNRAGRMIERVNSVPGMVMGAAIILLGTPAVLVGAPVATLGAAAFGGLVMAFSKVNGLVMGGIAHLIAKGCSGLADRLSENKPQTPAL